MRKWLFKALAIIAIVVSGAGCVNDEKTAQPENGLVEKINAPGSQSDNEIYNGQGWSFEYPKSFDKSTDRYIQESASGKNIQFEVAETTLEDLKSWIQSEIDRKLSATEATQTLVEPLSESTQGNLKVFRYVIRTAPGDRDPVELQTVIFFDGSKRYEFRTHQPPVTEEEMNMIISTFRVDLNEQ